MAVSYTAGYPRATPYPMTHARILHTTHAGTVTATSAADGFAAANAATVDTASWWLPTAAPATWTITYAAEQVVDAVGIAAHTLAGATVTVQALLSGAWATVSTLRPADNGAILAMFVPVSATAVRVITSAIARIGVIYTGQALVMPRMGYTSLGMADLGRQATLTSYISEGGQLLRRTIQRQGLRGAYQWANIPEDWWRLHGDAFALAARTEPFFIAARPEGYASDCVYAWVDQPIIPSRQGTRNWLTVGFEASAHADA